MITTSNEANAKNIVFFDSGLGGLSVLSEALDRLPGENYIYFADNLYVPYGMKPQEDVRRFILGAFERIMENEVKAIVVACNTATSLVVRQLRSDYGIPVIGMEPAVKPAVEHNRASGKRVLVLATPITLKQTKYAELISRLDGDHIVDSLPLPELVAYCEALNFDPGEIGAYFRDKLAPYDLNNYGTIVLGCTHYPFYGKLLKELLPPHIELVDGSRGTVSRLSDVLETHGLSNPQTRGRVTFSCSGEPAYIEKLERALALYRSELSV
ncbi:glutamate racemase [Paenibacillus xanthanilyticus]|uniref:Glutamate racemase n=1 Tax=Paenibacillus xanthanilyticus TaxID=1783531 RepID=A0ABV8K1Z6_9BACL